jgi:hypothetical protein
MSDIKPAVRKCRRSAPPISGPRASSWQLFPRHSS